MVDMDLEREIAELRELTMKQGKQIEKLENTIEDMKAVPSDLTEDYLDEWFNGERKK